MEVACPFGNRACVMSSRSPCCGVLKARLRLQAECTARRLHGPSLFFGSSTSSLSSPKGPTFPSNSRATTPVGSPKGPKSPSTPCTTTPVSSSKGPNRPSHSRASPPQSLTRATLAVPPAVERNPVTEPRPLDPDLDSAADEKSRERINEHLARSVALPSDGCNLVDVSCDRMHDFPSLVLMRHGESMWNDLKLFTGDVDIPLTEKGVMEAIAGGKAVADIDFSVIFTSRLMRSKQTALLAMTQNVHKGVPVIIRGGFHGKGRTGDANRIRLRAAAAQALRQAECRMIPVYADQALNERCYGDLQGLNKEQAEKTFGTELVKKWRRSHDTRPPRGESLKDTWERSLAFFMSTVEPRLAEGKNVLVVAHGNVLRCMISYLCELKEEEMLRLQIATAMPYAFSYDGDRFHQCCVLPARDPKTGKLVYGKPMGLTSAIKHGAVDSLI